MKQEELTITFYKIIKCGYYEGEDIKFSDTKDMLLNLLQWAKNTQSFVDTAILPNVDLEDSSNNLRNTYFIDLRSQSDNYLITLWNELPDVDGEVATLSKSKKIGDTTKCIKTKLPNNAIPGTASYFLFMPQHKCYATVCRKGRTNNNAEMIAYMQKFLQAYTPYCEIKEDGNDISVLGYKANPNAEIKKNITPCFKVSRAEDKDEIEFIKENCNNIKKILHKDIIRSDEKIKLDAGKTLLVLLGLKEPVNNIDDNRKIKYEIEYTPTKNELQNMIDKWCSESQDKYSDIGFSFKGEPAEKIHWLSGNISRGKRNLELEYIDSEIIEPTSLLASLNTCLRELIKEVNLI